MQRYEQDAPDRLFGDGSVVLGASVAAVRITMSLRDDPAPGASAPAHLEKSTV